MRRLIPLLALACCATAAEDPARERIRSELRGIASETSRLSRAFNLVHELVGPSVASIHTSDRVVYRSWTGRAVREVEAGEGSGFVVASDATASWILTNAHVVLRTGDDQRFVRNQDGTWAGYDRLRVVLHDNREVDAQYVGVDPQTDLAMVKVPIGDLPAIEWADSDQVKVGDWVLALGYPLGVGYSATAGIVSATDRSTGIYEAVGGFESFIQTDAPINPGNSGGPLVELSGRIVGINSNIVSRTGASIGLGFAIPANLARRVAEDLRLHGKVSRAIVGIQMADLDANEARRLGLASGQAVRVTDVLPMTPAATAGVRKDDVILAVDRVPVHSLQQFRARIAAHRPGETVKLSLWREGSAQEAAVALVAQEDVEKRLADAADAHAAKGTPAPAFGFRLLADGRDGLLIVAVDPGSLADQAGLTPGDRVLAEATLGKLSTAEDAKKIGALREGVLQVRSGRRVAWLRFRG